MPALLETTDVFVEGDTLYEAMHEDIARASANIRLECYILADDEIGDPVASISVSWPGARLPAGLMHSMIYWGFVVLFLGTVTLEIDHILPEQFQFLEGRVYQGYSAVLDLASLVFLGGLALAALARYGKRPWRIVNFLGESRLRAASRPARGPLPVGV